MVMNLFARARIEIDIENGLVDRVEKGEGEMNGESNIKLYTLPCGK